MGEPHYKPHPDDEGVDRIEIVAAPRYKTSGLSGDEWRVGAEVRFYRKGRVVAANFRTSMGKAAAHLAAMLDAVPGDSPVPLWGLDEGTCHQFGCAQPAEVVYRLRRECSARGEGPLPDCGQEIRRAFCAAHATRGDAGLEDSDDNYELLSGERGAVPKEAVSPAAFGGVIDLRKEA